MAMYCECPICGASLDHGEQCDCEKVPQKETTPPETAKVAMVLPRLRTV